MTNSNFTTKLSANKKYNIFGLIIIQNTELHTPTFTDAKIYIIVYHRKVVVASRGWQGLLLILVPLFQDLLQYKVLSQNNMP